MEDIVVGALIAVRDCRIDSPELWFDLISEVYEELERTADGADLEDFKHQFFDRTGIEGLGDAAEEFIRYVEYNGGIDVVRYVSRADRHSVLYEFEQLVEEASAPSVTADAEDADDEYDENAWNAFLVEYGGYWNGEDDTWDQFVEWFRYHAEDQGLGSPATAFIEYVADESDKVAVFARYGVELAGADDETEAGEETENADPNAWYSFLAEYGPGWNGEEENWEPFKEWFLYYADEHGVETTAAGFLEYAEGESDKVAFFAQYGVTVGETDADDASAVGRQKAEAAATESPVVADEHVNLVAESFAELVSEVPEAAMLSDAEIRQLIDEVAAEYLS
jgi:hypothetical protein